MKKKRFIYIALIIFALSPIVTVGGATTYKDIEELESYFVE
jgi:hypothetical protein